MVAFNMQVLRAGHAVQFINPAKTTAQSDENGNGSEH
jgi:hypothetical protein